MDKSIRERINSALKIAIKARDKPRISTLRLMNAAIKDRDIQGRADGHDKVSSDDQVLDVLARMVRQCRDSLGIYREAGRIDLVEREQREIDVLEEFLPRQLSPDECDTAVRSLIDELAARGLKDMGRVMGALKERYAGRMDFARAGAAARAALSHD